MRITAEALDDLHPLPHAGGEPPDQGIGISENIPDPATAGSDAQRASYQEALDYMQLPGGTPIKGVAIDVQFWFLDGQVSYSKVFTSYRNESIWRP